MTRHNTLKDGVSSDVPIPTSMKSSKPYLVLAIVGGMALSLGAVALWNVWAAFVAAGVAGIYTVVCIQALRQVRDRRLPYAEHMRHESDLLAAATFSLLSCTLSMISGLTVMGVGPVLASILGTLPGFAFYMYLIFGVTRHGEETVYDWFIKQPQRVVEAGMEPIKAAGEVQRAKDKQGER